MIKKEDTEPDFQLEPPWHHIALAVALIIILLVVLILGSDPGL